MSRCQENFSVAVVRPDSNTFIRQRSEYSLPTTQITDDYAALLDMHFSDQEVRIVDNNSELFVARRSAAEKWSLIHDDMGNAKVRKH